MLIIHKYKQLMQNQSGVSLVEFLVGIVIMLLIMLPISSSLFTGIKAYQYNMAQSQNITNTRASLNTIGNELRYATAISVLPGTPSTMPNATVTYTTEGQPRTMYAIAGTPSTTKTLVIAYDGVVQNQIASNNLQSIVLTRDTVNTKRLTISAHLNNYSYTGSPQMTTEIIVIMPNM